MKILFLTDNFPPETNAPATRTFEHCKEWVAKGAEVTVITGFPNFPKGKIYPGYKNKRIQHEEIEGIKVIRVWTFIAANKGFLKRTLDFLSFMISAFFAGLTVKTDKIVATSPQFFTALAGKWLSFWKRKPWIMEVRDIWPESIVAVGASKRNLIIKYFEWLEKRMYNSAKHIVVVTDSFKDNLINKNVPKDKISVFKNGVNIANYPPIPKNQKVLQDLKLESKFIFGYIGTHGMAHGLDFILNAIEPLQKSNPDFHFLFIGDGAERENLIQQSNKMELKNTTFLPSVTKVDVKKYLSVMDIALVNLKKSDTFLSVIPSKIFEAAAMGKPILLGLNGETKGIIQQYNAGLCFEPENKTEFINTSIKISEPSIYQEKKEGAFILAQNFEREKIASQMLNTIEKV